MKFRIPQGNDTIRNAAHGSKNTILTKETFISTYGKEKFYPKMITLSKNIVEKTIFLQWTGL